MKKHKEKSRIRNNAQVSSYISEGNPNVQKNSSSDQQTAQKVREAIIDDQGLSDVAKDIHVAVKEGTVTLDGQVATNQQINLATNTASALAVDDKIRNRMEIKHPEK